MSSFCRANAAMMIDESKNPEKFFQDFFISYKVMNKISEKNIGGVYQDTMKQER